MVAGTHAVRTAVHRVPRTVHAGTAVMHALRTVLRATMHGVRSAMLRAAVVLRTMLRTAVHGVLRAVTGTAVRAAAGRVMTICVWTGLAVMGHRAVMLRAAVVLWSVLRAMHVRGVSLWSVLRVFAMLAVRRMLSVLGMLTGCVRVFGAFRAILATARLVLRTNLARGRLLLGTFRATAVAMTMCRVRAFVRVGFVNVGRRTMPLRAWAGMVRHFAVVVAGLMVAVGSTFRLEIVVPCLIRLLVVRASIAFGTLGGIGPSDRRALHAGASESGTC